MSSRARRETGAALVLVVLGIFVFVAIGTFIILAVDRNADLRFAFQRNQIGFHSAEAGIHTGAVYVQNQMLNFALPTNCSAAGTSFNINGRTVTYVLSVPTGAPFFGVSGSCAETPVGQLVASGPYVGLNELLYTYNLTSFAKNTLGFREASINNQFQAHLIPMFQFVAFYSSDLEFLPGPSAVVNGRLHTNGDMYLNTDSCGAAPGAGLNVLGQITVVGSGISGTAPLNRGRKDDLSVNHDNVYISTDGTTSGLQVLGTNAPGSGSCAQVSTRQIGAAEINTFNNRVATGLTNISLPTAGGLLCVPWISTASGCDASGGQYWQKANLRIALDISDKSFLTATGQTIYQIKVLNPDGSPNATATANLQTFMAQNPGAITYTDVPSSGWNCDSGHGGSSACESTYAAAGSYTVPFPTNTAQPGCTVDRNPRDQITANNYCRDYRYGGFFNWREHKPMTMLNIDWMALEEYNNVNADVFFDHTTTINNGLIVFLTVKDTACQTNCEGYAANNYGVRVYDAGRARRNSSDPGVTFVTDQAMYIAGNFNCPQPTLGGGSTPAQCGDASWPPSGPSTVQKGTSLAADTINVLSCNWVVAQAGNPCGSFLMDNDQWTTVCGGAGASQCRLADEASTTQSGTILGGTVSCGAGGCGASSTVINAAFYASTDQTWCSTNPNGRNCGTTYYSGGLENYPRFHEDWSATGGFWYQGSWVQGGPPRHTCFESTAQIIAIGNDPNYPCGQYTLQGFWSTQRYVPPPRHWFYDVSFNNASYLPPLTPRFVYVSLVFFTQIYQ
jgi:hypothetical protein